MKKFLNSIGIIAIVFAVISLTLLLTTPAQNYSQIGVEFIFGNNNTDAILGKVSFILLLFAALIITSTAVLFFANMKQYKILLAGLALGAALLLIIGGGLCIAVATSSSYYYSNDVGIGWIIAGGFAIFGGLLSFIHAALYMLK